MANNDRAGALPALALLVMVLGGMAGLSAAPYLRLAALNEEVAESRQLLAALRAQMARQSGSSNGADPAALMLQGETAGIAGATLQRLCKSAPHRSSSGASCCRTSPTRRTSR